jgi:hypothetical protein
MMSPWPSLSLQVAYADIAWTVVGAAALLALVPVRWRATPGRALALALALIAAVGVGLHGVASGTGAQALGLALAQPSGLLGLLAAASLATAVAGAGRPAATGPASPVLPVLPTGWAVALVAVGLLLALDTVAVLSLQLYRLGLPGSPVLPVATVALAVLAVVLSLRPRQRPAALALAAAVGLHAALGLPTGNLWDALVDPVLWTWAAAALLRRAVGAAVAHNPAP